MGKATKKRKTAKPKTKKRKVVRSPSGKTGPLAPDPEDLAGMRKLFDVVRILDVNMLESCTRLRAMPEGTLRLGTRHSSRGGQSPDKSQVYAQVRFTLEGRIEGNEDQEPTILIEAVFQAVYDVPPDTMTNEEALALFAQTNGTFNLWPYWREFVQSMSTRMGLPGLTVPSYRIEQPAVCSM